MVVYCIHEKLLGDLMFMTKIKNFNLKLIILFIVMTVFISFFMSWTAAISISLALSVGLLLTKYYVYFVYEKPAQYIQNRLKIADLLKEQKSIGIEKVSTSLGIDSTEAQNLINKLVKNGEILENIDINGTKTYSMSAAPEEFGKKTVNYVLTLLGVLVVIGVLNDIEEYQETGELPWDSYPGIAGIFTGIGLFLFLYFYKKPK